MKNLTVEQAVVISAYTGFLCCEFSKMHEYVEHKLGRPVYSHMFGDEDFVNSVIRPACKSDFVALVPIGEGECNE